MATELPQPGVEVVQEFQSVSPTIVTPTLVPCNVAPFFEVIEVLDTDGLLNADAKLEDPYNQVNLELDQSSLPSPRGNIDEVNVEEDSIRVFFDFGSLIELSRSQGFMTSYLDPAVATQPYVVGTVAEPTSPSAGFQLGGRTLILHMDNHTAIPVTTADLPTSTDVTITFVAADGLAGSDTEGLLSIEEVIEQINAVIPGIASNDGSDKLKLTSNRFGAGASVVVRAGGTANAPVSGGTPVGLGFDADKDTIAVGSGFYAADDNDGDATTPRLRVYAGTYKKLIDAADDPVLSSLPDFDTDKLEPGDTIVADGVDIGEVEIVAPTQLTMEVEQNTMAAASPFAPRRVWVQANNLSYPAPATSTQATLTGTVQTAAATAAFVVGVAAPTFPVGASQSFDVDVTLAGVAQDTEVISSGSGWADLAAAIVSINSQATNFEAFTANDQGDEIITGTYLGLRTLSTNKGSSSGITFAADTTGMTVGYTTPPYADIGENIRYLPGSYADGTGASGAVSAAAVTSATSGETVIVTTNLGAENTITWGAGLTTLALVVAAWNAQAKYTEAYTALDTGVEDAAGTYFAIRTIGENFGTSATLVNNTGTDSTTLPATFSAAGASTDLANKTFKWSIDFNATVYEAEFVTDEDADVGGVSQAQVIAKINELTPGIAAASTDAPPYLVLTSQKYGGGSKILIGDGDANAILGLTTAASNTGVGRPAPDLAIDTDGDVLIQSQILRDPLTAIPYPGASGAAPIYVAYTGLRLDLSPEAANPSLLVIDDIDTLEAAADPISTDNPGALMCYLSLLNAPTVSIAAIGVPEVSADAPEGTPLGYAKCFEFLESEEVYALAVGTHSDVVHQAGLTHVNSMSEPEQKGERILFFNPEIPDRALPDLVGSGTDANSTLTDNEVTVEVNIAPALIAAGLDPNSDLNPATGEIENEVYLDIGDDSKNYLIKSVTDGVTLVLRTEFETDDGNADSFYSVDERPTMISDTWTVYIRGIPLVIPGTTRPDKNAIAETVQGKAQAYGFRRGFFTFPDQCGINVTGSEELAPAYYATACVAGMVGEQPPQQGFTNYPITGLTRIVGSNDQYTTSQLNVMAAGGVYVLVQETEGAPVSCRHQLSTDLSSIETRELSITKVVDYVAKFMRAGLRNFIGRSNITQPFIDNLATVVQGQIDFLSENGVIIGADINNLIQDTSAPDTVLIDVTLDVPYPCNYIRITLIV